MMATKPICISYPKSGRTWLRMILNSLHIDIEYSHLDAGANRKSWGKKFTELNFCCPQGEGMVFLYRDPRDVVVSMFYEFTKRQLPMLDPVLRSKYEIKGLIPPLTLGEFVKSPRFGIEKTIIFNILCKEMFPSFSLTYEKMLDSPIESISGLLDYLGEKRAFSEICAAVNDNDFTSMQKREMTGDIPTNMIGRLGPIDPSDINSYKARRGIVGGWIDEMDLETQRYANNLMRDYCYEARMKK